MSQAKETAEYLVNYLFDFNGYVLNESNKVVSKKFAKRCIDFAISKIDWHDFEVPNKELEELEQINIEIEKL